ncbi:hypothetical protein JCGZ_15187 [Jatropha curcas]|uniref:F-box domain-containing protein n=1 Tax=Jatropha curcas TaxID=180498 RepID=A0A067K6Z0_JATCU|nr:hypothetical protein JCGZ_15187 [Jatropha curcas]
MAMISKKENPDKEIADDLIVDILLKLPIKSVARFRSTSKRWQSVISDLRFARSHVNHNRINAPHQNSLIFRHLTMLNSESLEKVVKQNDKTVDVDSNDLRIYKFSIPSKDRLNVSCCCDGILCATISIMRFGYDSTINDYKVVHVPSATTDTRRHSRRNTIIGFNLATEVFWEVLLPPSVTPSKGPLQLRPLNSCLSLSNNEEDDSFLEVWVLKDKKQSAWSKFITIPYSICKELIL